MVKRDLFDHVHSRLKQLKGLSKSPHAPFGNTSILVVGDYFQLPSVGSEVICKNPFDNCGYLWSQFVLYRLEEIIRQRGDSEFGDSLNDIRTRKRVKVGQRTAKGESSKMKSKEYEYEPLSSKTETLLKSREIKYAPEDASYPTDVLHLYARNAAVAEHNRRILQTVCQNVRKIEAVDFLENKGKRQRLAEPIVLKDPKEYQLPELHLAEGARIILKYNLDVSDGLCNGATGQIVKIYDGKLPYGQPEVLFIKFDNDKVGRTLRMNTVYPSGIPDNTVPIKPFKGVVRRHGSKTVRSQFPITLAWAITIHNSQGQTLQRAVVSFKNIDFPGQIYVALSRVTSSQGLHIIDLDLSKIYCDSAIDKCYDNMPKLQIGMQKLPKTHELTIVHHNVEGLKEHINDLQRCTQLQPSDVICVTETWLSTNDDIQMPGYSFQGRTREECYLGNCDHTSQIKTAKNGGVGIFLADSFVNDSNISITDISNKQCSLEHMAISVHDSKRGITSNIIVIYRPPKLPHTFTHNQLTFLLETLPPSSRVILVGDMNEDTSKGNTLPLHNLMTNHGFTQIIHHPTTIGRNGAILDNVYIKSEDGIMPNDQGVIPTHYSYHEAVYVTY